MKKFKGLLLLALCAIAAPNAKAQVVVHNAQDVIDMLTANGGYCQTLYYSASYQQDYGHDVNRKSTNNMWIKDSFGKARFVQKLDEHQKPVIKPIYTGEEEVLTDGYVVTLVDAFGGLFDWDLCIAGGEDNYVCTAQLGEDIFPVKNDPTKYVRVHLMSNLPYEKAPDVEETVPTRKKVEYDLSFDSHLLQLWTSVHDDDSYEWLGATPWGHDKFDASLYLNPFYAGRWYFLRLAVKQGDWQNPQEDDYEISHYDFYLAEFRHYNPNTIINDTHNGEGRSFGAIADFVKKDEQTTQFWIHNFSGFGPCYTQKLGTETDDDLDELLEGTGLTQLNRGYGEGIAAEIHPITGYYGGDNKILIKRSENPAGFAHYHRAYEAIKNVEGVTPQQIEANKFNPAITLWHDCRIAGLVEGKYSRDDAGNIIPESITALKDEVTGTWADSQRHHHAEQGVASTATNPWVSDGGTCRTVSTTHLHIDPYVYCTDEQLADGMNPNSGKSGHELYDWNDDYKRGGIYELIDIETTDEAKDITLQLAIDNHEVYVGGVPSTLLKESICQYKITEKVDGKTVDKHFVACPVMFDVTANEQFVDHYEVCAYHSKDIEHPVVDASDAEFANADSKLNEIMTPAATYVLPKNETGHYEAFELETPAQTPEDKQMVTTTLPRYTKVLSVPLDGEHKRELETFTFYVKAVYTEESGLAPTYHSLTNVIVQEGLVTGVKDVNVDGGVKAVAGVYSITGQYLGNQVPEGRGVFVVRYTDGSAAKVAVK